MIVYKYVAFRPNYSRYSSWKWESRLLIAFLKTARLKFPTMSLHILANSWCNSKHTAKVIIYITFKMAPGRPLWGAYEARYEADFRFFEILVNMVNAENVVNVVNIIEAQEEDLCK